MTAKSWSMKLSTMKSRLPARSRKRKKTRATFSRKTTKRPRKRKKRTKVRSLTQPTTTTRNMPVDGRIGVYMVGGRDGNSPLGLPAALENDVFDVIFEADETAVAQIRER